MNRYCLYNGETKKKFKKNANNVLKKNYCVTQYNGETKKNLKKNANNRFVLKKIIV